VKSGTVRTYFGSDAVYSPVAGDVDGDGMADAGFIRGAGFWEVYTRQLFGGWYVIPLTCQWGLPGDIAVPGDYDGTGFTDVAVFRPSTGVWYILHVTGYDSQTFYTGNPIVVEWGLATDIPVPADYDGDGKTDIAVFRPGNGVWYILQSSQNNAPLEIQFGLPGDVPMPGDYLGNGRAQVGVYRPSAGLWYTFPDRLRPTQWGMPGDIPVAGDYDGDRRLDFTVYRPSTGQWFVLMSRANFRTYLVRQWGTPADIPMPAPK
jgi:hypothetical protein